MFANTNWYITKGTKEGTVVKTLTRLVVPSIILF